MNLDKIIATNFNWDKRQSILEELSKDICVKFAIFCAEQVVDLSTKKKNAQKAIDTAKLYLEGKASREECSIAADAAAYAAHAAANAAYAAAAAAYSAANAAYAAATAAAYAAYAAYATNAAAYIQIDASEIKSTHMSYLRQLVLDNLSYNQREEWLLIASI